MNATIKNIWNFITWLMVICVALLAILLAGVRLIGLTPYTVLSGSMEPFFHVGALIYVEKISPENVVVGDPICFVLNDDLVVVTHRVVEIDEANHFFITKGDANDSADGAPVLFENLVGKAVFSIPYLGYFSNWLIRPPGLYIGITFTLLLFLFILAPELLDRAVSSGSKSKSHKL